MLSTTNKRVLMPVYGYAPDDPRVVFEGTLAQELGYDVVVLGLKTRQKSQSQTLKFQLIPLTNSYNPLRLIQAIWELVGGNTERIQSASTSNISTLLSILFFNLWLIRIGFHQKPALIHCHEHQGLFGSWILSKLRGCKIIYDVHESTMHNRSKSGIKGRMAISMETFLLKRVHGIITVGERLAKLMASKGAQIVVIIGNWKSQELYTSHTDQLEKMRLELNISPNHLIVSYIGALETNRDLLPLLNAIEKCKDVHLIVAGRGSLVEIIEKIAQDTPNIHWLGWLDLEYVPKYTQLSDVIYCSISPTLEQNEYVVPNKLFEAFAASKALIARKNIGEMAEILKKYPIALMLEDATSEILCHTFDRLKDVELLLSLQSHAKYGQQNYNRSIAKTRLNELYEQLIYPTP